MDPPVKREWEVPTGPSNVEPSPAPDGPDSVRPRSNALPEVAPGHEVEEAKRSKGPVRGFLARLIPSRGAWTGTTHDAEFEVAARKAYETALKNQGVSLAPAPRSARSAGARTPEPSAASPATQASAAGPATKSITPGAIPTTAPAPELTTRGVAPDSPEDPVAAAVVRKSASVALPTSATGDSPTPEGGSAESGSTARVRHELGETALDSLLQAPPSVTLAADHFFDGLVRRVEGNR